jgi:4-hydroxybenzoate polyprenyltransferase
VSPHPLLRLLRIPNVFTAVANVAAGALLARGGSLRPADALLCAASACLYLAGMALNDYFDRDTDAVERPERPLPSGQVAPLSALLLGAGLLAAGVGLAAASSSLSGAVAGALAGAILLYDGALKDAPLGPFAMGACRFLNVCLGLSVAGAAPPERWMWIAPITMGAYTAALTGLSRDEVGGTSRARAREAIVSIAVVLLGALIALAAASPAGRMSGFLWLTPFAALVAWQARALFGAVLSDPSAAAIGRAIGGGILLMPAIDASMVAAGGWPEMAVLVAALALPAHVLRRWYAMT